MQPFPLSHTSHLAPAQQLALQHILEVGARLNPSGAAVNSKITALAKEIFSSKLNDSLVTLIDVVGKSASSDQYTDEIEAAMDIILSMSQNKNTQDTASFFLNSLTATLSHVQNLPAKNTFQVNPMQRISTLIGKVDKDELELFKDIQQLLGKHLIPEGATLELHHYFNEVNPSNFLTQLELKDKNPGEIKKDRFEKLREFVKDVIKGRKETLENIARNKSEFPLAHLPLNAWINTNATEQKISMIQQEFPLAGALLSELKEHASLSNLQVHTDNFLHATLPFGDRYFSPDSRPGLILEALDNRTDEKVLVAAEAINVKFSEVKNFLDRDQSYILQTSQWENINKGDKFEKGTKVVTFKGFNGIEKSASALLDLTSLELKNKEELKEALIFINDFISQSNIESQPEYFNKWIEESKKGMSATYIYEEITPEPSSEFARALENLPLDQAQKARLLYQSINFTFELITKMTLARITLND